MAADATNRKVARKALAALLDTALTGVGNPAQAVYDHRNTTFNPESPVVLVMGGGSKRNIRGIGSDKYGSQIRFEVAIFVAEADTDDSWTDTERDDAMDDIEKIIADVVADNQDTADWNNLRHDEGFSQPIPATVGGDAYEMEVITLIGEVRD